MTKEEGCDIIAKLSERAKKKLLKLNKQNLVRENKLEKSFKKIQKKGWQIKTADV